MYSNSHEVLQQALDWSRAGKRVALLTVLQTFGASPRPPGSMAAVSEDGMVVGSVSGGCVEDDLVRTISSGGFWQSAMPVKIHAFGKNARDRARYRLPCGNELRIAVESSIDTAHLEAALSAISAHRKVLRCVNFLNGQVMLLDGLDAPQFTEDETGFRNMLGPRYRLLIIGASELGQYLTNIAQTLDYAVTVCDPRAEYADQWNLPATILSREMPDDLVLSFACDQNTAVVAVTHDPKLDDLALMEALKTPAFYVGALGSIATNAKRRERLLEFDVSPEQVARLRGPVGIRIGSRSPAEIAVSIAAELIQERHRIEQATRVPVAECASEAAS
jgi:xanthine dehydrogenase accessory factor